MRFSIILSIDGPREMSITELFSRPKRLHKTEGNEQFEYDHIWPKGKHRKYCGILNQASFERMIQSLDLRMSTTDTMGMIGAPHLDCMGWSPAFSFDCDDSDSIINAYVCPLPNQKEQRKFPLNEEGWDKIKEYLLENYG